MINLFVILICQAGISGEDGKDVNKVLSELGYEQIKMYKNEFNEYEIEARINGGETIRVLLDPSNTCYLFNKRYLYYLDIPYYETNRRITVYGDSDDLAIATIDSLVIGNAIIKTFDTEVVEFHNIKYLEENYVEGIIGRDFLIKYQAIIDYSNEFLYLRTYF